MVAERGIDATELARPLRPGQGPQHPRLRGALPRVQGHGAREHGLFTLAQAVHKMTGLTAQRFGLAERGLLQLDAADITVFDPATVADRARYTEPPPGMTSRR